MYWWSPNLSQISLTNSFGKVVFQILAKIEMTRNENGLFGRHFETVQILHIFFPEIWLWLVYIYGVKIITKFWWESGFLKEGFHGTPLCTNESAGYLMQLSVNPISNQSQMQPAQWGCRSYELSSQVSSIKYTARFAARGCELKSHQYQCSCENWMCLKSRG